MEKGKKNQTSKKRKAPIIGIIVLSETENLVTVMWANEIFDQEKPDTFFEIV